ncbi:MAG: hypothetical protein BGN86_04010 [Caulobacterales bacterium 68-7]|nr:MAG: hypothetical protein BGN86_04010 [Caulobacterales bacterium 68-7]
MVRIVEFKPGRFSIEATSELVAALRQYGVCFSSSPKNRFKAGERLVFSQDTQVEPYCGYLEGENIFSLGAFSFSHAALPAAAKVGRYCSIGERVNYFGSNHPTGFVSTSPFFYETKKGFMSMPFEHEGVAPRKVDLSSTRRRRAVVEHDVWIGEGVTLGWNLTVGVGSVIAARSVVTKDVPPYAIVAGVPAKVVRFRFPEELAARLLASGWWNYNLTKFYDLPFNDPEQFVEGFEALKAAGALTPLPPPRPLIDVLTELGFA